MRMCHILVFQGCFATPAVTSFEILTRIDGMRSAFPSGRRRAGFRFQLVACARGREVRTNDGLAVHCHASLSAAHRPDLVIVPAFDGDVRAQLEENRPAVGWLKRQFERGADVASICTGAVLLAEAGLLDGRPATTHWMAEPLFRARYPRVELRPHQLIVDEGRVITCGGAFSFLHLLMYLAEKHYGADVAAAAHRMFLIDVNGSPQSAYAIFGAQKGHRDEAILKAQEAIERGPGGELSIPELAEQVSLSRRHFVRRFKQATGNTPIEYIQRVRVEAAKKALFESRQPFDDIAWSLGYSDSPGFRKIFVRHTGLTPTEYRRRFNPAYAPPSAD